ncbi:MAG: hypothetical protein HY735_28560 [Verrucomicrobia bacterium]|nr:hypothetical protein [Verrucomicrobiota bacterium]
MEKNSKNGPSGFLNRTWRRGLMLWIGLSLTLSNGCSIRKYAINRLGDALSQTGTTFASDEDPDLIKDAAPFSLKLIESLLAETPTHRSLLLAAASGFTQYAYAFVQQPADEIEERDLAAADAWRARARRLYLRARDYGLRGLAAAHPGFPAALRENPKQTVRRARKTDVPLIYWTAAAWASAIALAKDNPELVADLPIIEAMIDQALELEESYADGALHTFLVSYEMSRRTASGDPAVRSRRHFERARDLSRGRQAAPFVALAEAVTVQKQDVKEFEFLLNQALAIDPNADPEQRLINLVMQRRARWLLSRKAELFLIPDP